MKENCKQLFKDKISLIIMLISFVSMILIINHFTNKELICWNYNCFYFWSETILHILIALLFAIFIWAQFYKIKFFHKFSIQNSTSWLLWSIFWILVTWCPTCSITLASYLWLSSLIAILPWWWIELKILGLWLLIFSVYKLCKNLTNCSLNKKHK